VLRYRDLRLAPGLLAVLLLVTSLGPWGVRGHSIKAQVAELKAVFEASGMMKDGRLVPSEGRSKILLPTDANRVRSGIGWLGERRALDRIAPWGDALQPNPFVAADVNTNWYNVSTQVLKATGAVSTPTRSASLYGTKPSFIATATAGTMVGPLNVNRRPSGSGKAPEINGDNGAKLTIYLEANVVHAIDAQGTATLFDIPDSIGGMQGTDGAPTGQRPAVLLTARTGGSRAQFLVIQWNGMQKPDGSGIDSNWINGWLMLPPPQP
jgi:hypothetical protein